eukprot:4382064-Prymnesium_polylepis.1
MGRRSGCVVHGRAYRALSRSRGAAPYLLGVCFSTATVSCRLLMCAGPRHESMSVHTLHAHTPAGPMAFERCLVGSAC